MAIHATREAAEAAIKQAVANHDPESSCDQSGADAWSIRCPLPSHEDGSNNEFVQIGVWERKRGEFLITAKCWADCDSKAIRQTLGLWDEPKTKANREPDHTWLFPREDGPPFPSHRKGHGKDKECWTDPGQKIKGTNVKPMAFGQIGDDDVILIVEGEPCAEAASRLPGYVGVTWPSGVKTVTFISHKGWHELTTGRKAILWPDNDPGGIRAMHVNAGIIADVVSELLWVDPTGLGKSEDIADVSTETALKMLAEATPYEPPKHGGKREGAGRKAPANEACFRKCDKPVVEEDVANAVDALNGSFRILQNRLFEVDKDNFWHQSGTGTVQALARAVVKHLDACTACSIKIARQVWEDFFADWVMADRPQPNRYRAFNIKGQGYRAFTIGQFGAVELKPVKRDMLITWKPKRVIGDYTADWPQTMWLEESGDFVPLMRDWIPKTRDQFTRMIAKSHDRDAMFGDDMIINLIGPTGSGKGTWIEQVRALLEEKGVAMPVQKRQGMHWAEDKAFTRNNLVIINEANNPGSEWVERALAASDSTIEINEKNEKSVNETARCRIIFVGTRSLSFEASTGMGRRILPFQSGGEAHIHEGADDTFKQSAVSDDEITKLFWRLHDSLPEHYSVGYPCEQVMTWKEDVLNEGDPYRAFLNQFAMTPAGVETPLKEWMEAYCRENNIKEHNNHSRKLASALNLMDGVEVPPAPKGRPRIVKGAMLMAVQSSAQATSEGMNQ